MTLVVTLIAHVLQAASILLFPLLALWAWRSRGPSGLWRTTGLGVGLILLFAAITASAPAGNALAPTYGYSYTAPRALLFYGLTLGLPLVSVGLTVHAFAGRLHSRPGLYTVGLISATLAWVVGVLTAYRILSAIA